MTKSTITLHTLSYSKADLDAVPERDRTFYLMATGLANDAQMLSKTMAIILVSHDEGAPKIVDQANSSYALLMLRLIAGRLWEGWKLIAAFSKDLKANYEPSMDDQARGALKRLRAYFNPKGGHSLIHDVRDHVAFHSLSHTFEKAYQSLDPAIDLGEYLCETMGNTLYYTTEVLQYEALRQLANAPTHIEAMGRLVDETHEQTMNFNAAIYGFASVFVQKYLPHRISAVVDDTEVIEVTSFRDIRLPFFSKLPPPK